MSAYDPFDSVLDNPYLKYLKNNKNSEEYYSQEYDRKKYDDEGRKKQYKNKTFNKSKVVKDKITGKEIHYSTNSAKNKYKSNSGSKAWTDHATEVDHIIPLKEIDKRTKYNSFMSAEEKKAMANRDFNYRVTSKRFNATKGANSDIKMAFDKNTDIPLEGRINLLKERTIADIGITTESAVVTAKNITKTAIEGGNEALQVYGVPILLEGIHNLYLVANKEKSFDEAADDMGLLTANIIIEGGKNKVFNVTLDSLKKLLNDKFKNITTNIKIMPISNELINLVMIIGESIIKFVNGEIDGKEFFEEIGEKGVIAMASAIGGAVGEMLVPIPVVGAFIGSIIVSTVCAGIYKLKDIYKSINKYKEKVSKVNRLANEALREMERQRNVLKKIIYDEFSNWDSNFDSAFNMIYNSAINDDTDGIAIGLNNILETFNKQVYFSNRDEFDEFFNGDDPIFTF